MKEEDCASRTTRMPTARSMRKGLAMFREEQRINQGFEKWYTPNTLPFHKHVQLCAFHAGARFQQKRRK